MADLNDFNYTDDLDDVLAIYVNNLLASTMRSEYKNVETLSADRTLLDADTPIQRLDCNGAGRIVKVPTVNAVENHIFFIVNSSAGNYSITLKSNDGATTLATINKGASALAVPDGAGTYKVIRERTGYSIIAQSTTVATIPDATTYYMGILSGTGFSGVAANRKIYIPKAGTITRVDIHQLFGTAGSNEASTMYIRLNDTTDTTITTAIDASTASLQYNVTGLSIAVVEGDWITLKWVTPTWATNPINLFIAAQIWVE